MDDRDRWDCAITAIRADYDALPSPLQAQVDDVSRTIRGARRELHSLAQERGSETICACCCGECCLRGKYHITVADILVFLAEREPLISPRFDRDTCPYLDDHGCMMEPSLRPFPCITFNCERVEGLWEPERVAAFYRGERQLRALLGELERLFAHRAGAARRMAVLEYGNNLERCTDGDNDQ